ncbi:glycosyltransferase [Haloarculaceae archaeon H-GB2-1]|nr:glycosyltransferase [Haloarculaceae archaeon H-GB1-1]MEA5388466.1 glycosyltransferase [Haloarculaceae archaeon H-GB11]MEA5406502.1 glycosyltransferase [Haloarculaceae archaeon H-GB2-1]
MRIAFFIPYYREGGVETTTHRLASVFHDRGHSVDLLTFQHESPYLGPDSPFQVVDLDAERTLTSLPEVVRYLRRQRPDGVIAVHYFTNVVSVVARSLAGVSSDLILTERISPSRALAEEGPVKSRLLLGLMRGTYPLSDARVTVSKDAAADLASLLHLEPDTVTPVYNPTLTQSVFRAAREPLDHPWFESDDPVVLGVGRLSEQKDFETLLRSFEQLSDDTKLVLLGEGEKRSSLESLIVDLGIDDRVEMPGYVENPYKYMSRADVFALSSRFEGMPNVLVEAVALETPVVATDCPTGPRELLGSTGAGAIVPVGEPGAMAEALTSQLAHPESARRDLQELRPTLASFRPPAAADKYLSLLKT